MKIRGRMPRPLIGIYCPFKALEMGTFGLSFTTVTSVVGQVDLAISGFTTDLSVD